MKNEKADIFQVNTYLDINICFKIRVINAIAIATFLIFRSTLLSKKSERSIDKIQLPLSQN